MPRSFLKTSSQNAKSDSALANFAFLSRADNRQLGGVAPSVYRGKMAPNWEEITAAAICPTSLFADDYSVFLNERAKMLLTLAAGLCS
jgi:hypothetical protein